MSVIRTDKWLAKAYHRPVELCEKLEPYFKDAHAQEIYDFLLQHGMYHPVRPGLELANTLQEKQVWQIVRTEEHQLQKLWDCPDIPIFIFPSERRNRKLMREFNGKSGLAFKDKLFLFLSEDNNETEIQALFTHEMNHVCRLSRLAKNEEELVLLDSIILEGLAENAVRERFGEDYVAPWTEFYPDKKLEEIWKNLILPNRQLAKNTRKHFDLLYGARFFPKMAGYCVGYYLVKQYMLKNRLTSKELLDVHAHEIAPIKPVT